MALKLDLLFSLPERIVMTPTKKTSNSTTLLMERKVIVAEKNKEMHIAGGSNQGIVVNKARGNAEGKQIKDTKNSTSNTCMLYLGIDQQRLCCTETKYTAQKETLTKKIFNIFQTSSDPPPRFASSSGYS